MAKYKNLKTKATLVTENELVIAQFDAYPDLYERLDKLVDTKDGSGGDLGGNPQGGNAKK